MQTACTNHLHYSLHKLSLLYMQEETYRNAYTFCCNTSCQPYAPEILFDSLVPVTLHVESTTEVVLGWGRFESIYLLPVCPLPPRSSVLYIWYFSACFPHNNPVRKVRLRDSYWTKFTQKASWLRGDLYLRQEIIP